MRLYRVPSLVQKIFHRYTWRIRGNAPTVYITFDDGPNPEVTPFVLDILSKRNIKATFFCVGENVDSYLNIAETVHSEGHILANHTYNHLKGWETKTAFYLDNIEKASNSIEKLQQNKIFRPPYGRITKSQSKSLINSGYKIIMWHILTYDYDKNLPVEKALKQICKQTRNGSIVVFHDSIKAMPQLKRLLPAYLDYLIESGFEFNVIQ